MSVIKKRRGDRHDSRLVRKIDEFNKIFPYLMRGRNESAVYFKQQVRVEKTKEFLKELNRTNERTYTVFHLVLTALVRTMSLHPQLNRFVAGNRLYTRDEVIISFVMKKARNEAASEVILRIKFDKSDTIFDVAKKAKEQIGIAKRDNSVLGEDKTIGFFLKLPRFIINGCVKFFMYLNRFDMVPKSILDVDPMCSSAFLSNLGSYDINPPYHHLYEWGNSSLFIVMGNIHDEPCISDDNQIEVGQVLDFAFTIDERISDGYYFSKAVRTFAELIKSPQTLVNPPENLPVDE